jgi:GNAT superfamily N-acetyltransferase
VPIILKMIKALAEYEQMADAMVATEDSLREGLFGPRPFAEVMLGFVGAEAAGYALFFHNFSTFRGAPGIFLEDLFVEPAWRGRGFGRALLVRLAAIAVERGCQRVEWVVLDWNAPAIAFYRGAGADMLEDWRVCRLTGDALRDLSQGGPGA